MNPDTNSIYPQTESGGVEAAKDAQSVQAEQIIQTMAIPQPAQPTIVPAATNNFMSESSVLDNNTSNVANVQPVAVVKVLSTRGLEYLFMSICLWIGATGLIWALILLVNGQTKAQLLAFPATSLIVCLPLFAWLFIRLKKAELANPVLRFDSSKRRTSQITQVIAFLTSLFNIITFVYLIIASTSGNAIISVGKAVLNLLVILVVAGGILAYYWVDEHRSFNK